jgi:hypothetical protein
MNSMLGTCKLCLRPDVELQMSHYMPAALYPKNIKLEYLSRGGVRTVVADNEIKAPLLCFECEQRFSEMGESEVLRHIAGKIANKPSPLLAKLSPLTVKEEDVTLKSYCGAEAGLNMDMFAYFALSIAWRATFSWPVAGEDDTKPLTLGLYREPVRRFLAGKTAEFPRDTAVIVIVCTDKMSREAWFLPAQTDDIWFHDIRFLAFGVMFRVTLGKDIPPVLRRDSCHADGKRIHVGDASSKTRQALDYLEKHEQG